MRWTESYNYSQNSEIVLKNFLHIVKMTATAAAVAFVVFSCKGKLGEAAALDLSETPVQIVENMFVVQTENSGLQMRAEAPLMEKYEKDTLSYELFPKGFFVYGYTDEGLLETRITSDNARHLKYKDGRESSVW